MSNFDPDDRNSPWENERDPWDAYADEAAEPSAQDRWADWGQLGTETVQVRPAGTGVPHSKLGVASLVITLVAGMGTIISVAGAAILASRQPAAPANDPQFVLLGCGIIGSLLLAAAGGLMGFIALFQPGRNRLFAVLGCVFAALQIGGVVVLLMIGIMFG